MPLTDTAIRNAKPRRKLVKLFDGGGLYLLIQPYGTKLWRQAYRINGKQKTLAFGIYPTVSLADARGKRDAAKKILEDEEAERECDEGRKWHLRDLASANLKAADQLAPPNVPAINAAEALIAHLRSQTR